MNADYGALPDEPKPVRRAWEIWSESDYERLVELVRAGLPVEDIAEQLGRGVIAVAGRCQLLLPPGVRVPRSRADLELRDYLADPDYDWRAGLREAARHQGRIYWDRTADNLVQAGWDQARPLHELVTATGAAEYEVARRLVELDLAESVIAVAERLGCRPGATLDLRVRMAADRAAAAVWVLVADGLLGSQRARTLDDEDGQPMYRHVSLHADQDEAQQTLDRLLAAHVARGGTAEQVTITLAARTVGERDIGKTLHSRDTLTPW